MKSRRLYWASLLLLIFALWPVRGDAWTTTLRVVQDRTYRLGVFMVVDALVKNISPRRVQWVEVSVEFYNFFDELMSVEHTVLRPLTLGPGQIGALRVVTPFSHKARKIAYRFTWQQDSEQFQDVARRDIWLN